MTQLPIRPNVQTSPLKVLHLGSPGPLYGAERWILALVRHLDSATVHSIVGAIKDAPSLTVPLCGEAEKLGCPTHVFEAYGRFNFSAVSQLRRFIIEQDVRILHTHFYKTDLLGLLATWGTKCKIISTPHGWSRHMDFKLWCYEMLDRGLFLFMDAVAPLSEDLYQPLRKLPGLSRKLHYIRNGVDISEIDEQTEVHEEILTRKKDNQFILGYIGQLIPRKGLDVLLKALGTIREQPWALFLIGEGESRAELAALAGQLRILDRVHFMGFRKDRLSFLKGFDAFVLPSRLEGIPRCLMEAMVAGVPVVASDIPGCRDLITNQKNGLLFPPEDEKALAQTLDKLIADKAQQESLAANGRRTVLEKFSAQRMAEEYLDLYTRLTR